MILTYVSILYNLIRDLSGRSLLNIAPGLSTGGPGYAGGDQSPSLTTGRQSSYYPPYFLNFPLKTSPVILAGVGLVSSL